MPSCDVVVDSRRDLRLQKDQNKDEQGWDAAGEHHPHWESLVFSEGVDQPASFGWVGHHQTFGNDQFLKRNARHAFI